VFNSKPTTWDRSKDTISFFRTVIPRGQLSFRTDPTFKHHRRLMGPAMTSKYLSSTTPKAAQAASELVELFMAKAKIAGDRGFQAEDDLNNATLVGDTYLGCS
jgi:cytochrome P450